MTGAAAPPAPPSHADFAGVTDLVTAHAVFRAWLFGQALPFWGSFGHDGKGGGAREYLRLDGQPAPVPYKRMRVQARQIYAFSHAALLGWPDGERLARDGYAFITRCGERADGGWVRQLSPAGNEVLDGAIDLYDQAFVLFALAWYARLTQEAAPLRRARLTTEWIRANMAAAPLGFCNVLPAERGPRQQNPHMHLLEAALALLETSGDAYYAEFARELVTLFRCHLFDAGSGTIGEFFAPDWSPAPGAPGDHIEPGHQYEWVWLLDQYERLTGDPATAELQRLYAFATAFGNDPETALVWDAVSRDGAVTRRSTRLWPQTEALRAHAVMARRGAVGLSPIPAVVRNIGTRFFAGCPAGTWIDQFAADGAAASDKIPTSSFYHVVTGFSELDALVARLARRGEAHVGP